MEPILLRTKLYIPTLRENRVSRPYLIKKLDKGWSSKLILVSAPAGYGKTTLVAEWIDQIDTQINVCWLSLDSDDSDPQRFFSYLAAATESLSHSTQLTQAAKSPQPLPPKSMMAAFINDLIALTTPVLLILDDYHLIEAPLIDEGIAFLLDHLPPHARLAITTREDPPFPLARYRAKGELTELRASDLRFSAAESAQFLNKMMALSLTPEEINALEMRTEGWITGLQLAAISMQGRTDITGFIEAFSGSHHFILDYLIEDVLQRQPEDVRSFLLQTSILKTLTGLLCDAVTEGQKGRHILNRLERENLFTIPLDDQRHAYRYHHLFAEVLQARLAEEATAGQISELHLRASRWFEQNDQPLDAIRHALAAEDFTRAASLIEQIWPSLHRSNLQTPILLDFLQAIPNEFIHNRPVLCVGYGWSLLNNGEIEAAEAWLQQAESWLDPNKANATGMIFCDQEEFDLLPAEIGAAQAYLALALGDVAQTITHAENALNHLPQSKHIRRGILGAILGLAHWAMGELEAAHQNLTDSKTSFQKAENIIFALSPTYGLADIRLAQGKLHAATQVYTDALQLASAHQADEYHLQGTTDLYLGLAGISFEQGNWQLAAEQLQKCEELGQPAALPDWPYRLARFKAQLKQAEGEFDTALNYLDEAEALYVRTPVPMMRPLGAERARISIAQGELSKAEGWAQSHNLIIEDPPSFLREFEQITLARLLIATGYNPEELLRWLERLQKSAEAGGRMGSVIEILLLQTIVYLGQHKTIEADNCLQHAILLAEPEGYVQLFVQEGDKIHQRLDLLKNKLSTLNISPTYVQKLVSSFAKSSVQTPSTQPLDDPLSEREMDVLKLLATDLTGPEIADQLMVSLNTMRTHTKNIYSKLGVHSRRTAVRQAEELRLL